MESCSLLRRGEPILGTAPREDGYLIVEHPKPWPEKVKRIPGLVCELRRALKDFKGEDLKLLVTPSLPDSLRMGEGPQMLLLRWAQDRALWSVLPATSEKLIGALREPAEGTDAPLYLVCTHGSRDRCCGTFGYPIFHALDKISHRAVLQVSHLGGHRYAPVVAAFPEWKFFGHLKVADLEHLDACLESGRSPGEFYRGCGRWKAEAQVVEGHLWEKFGPRFRHLEKGEKAHDGHFYFATLESGEKIRFKADVECIKLPGYKSCEDVNAGKPGKVKHYRLLSLEEFPLSKSAALQPGLH